MLTVFDIEGTRINQKLKGLTLWEHTGYEGLEANDSSEAQGAMGAEKH